ncbi:MAG: hypothetical protein NVS3B27_22790 [Novosphingobium sp.]
MLIGIDLGTTNSAVAIWRDGVAELIPNALGDPLTPSAVSIDRQRQCSGSKPGPMRARSARLMPRD